MTPFPANSETKEARTMKLCTVIAYYITSITKQLKFLNDHCSIVCSYCSVVCLIAKNELKMIEFSSSLKLNQIHIVDSPFNEDPKKIVFFSGRDGRKIQGKSAITGASIVMQIWGWSISKENIRPNPLVPKSL